MLRGILAAQGNLKARRAARRPALRAFASPALARASLADVTGACSKLVNVLAGVFYRRDRWEYGDRSRFPTFVFG